MLDIISHSKWEFRFANCSSINNFTVTEGMLARWLVESYGLWEYRPWKWRNMSHGAGGFVWLFVKIILLLNMGKEEPNFNMWGDISDSELVLETAKIEQKYERQQRARDLQRNFAVDLFFTITFIFSFLRCFSENQAWHVTSFPWSILS